MNGACLLTAVVSSWAVLYTMTAQTIEWVSLRRSFKGMWQKEEIWGKKKKKKGSDWKEKKMKFFSQTEYLLNSSFPATLSKDGPSLAFTRLRIYTKRSPQKANPGSQVGCNLWLISPPLETFLTFIVFCPHLNIPRMLLLKTLLTFKADAH